VENSEQKSNSAVLLVTTACVLLLIGIFGAAYEASNNASAPSTRGTSHCFYALICLCPCVLAEVLWQRKRATRASETCRLARRRVP